MRDYICQWIADIYITLHWIGFILHFVLEDCRLLLINSISLYLVVCAKVGRNIDFWRIQIVKIRMNKTNSTKIICLLSERMETNISSENDCCVNEAQINSEWAEKRIFSGWFKLSFAWSRRFEMFCFSLLVSNTTGCHKTIY